MKVLPGRIEDGVGDFRRRMTRYPEAFRHATGERLFPGTVNLHFDEEVPIREHFRILGSDIGEPEQDLLFEVIRVNGLWAYRIRPLHLATGAGGHGDHVCEVASAVELRPTLSKAESITVEFFR